MSEENGADVSLNLAGQQINVRNVKSLNTLLTVACAVGVGFLAYLIWEHKGDAKEVNTALVQTLKELTVSQRVTNCLMATRQEEREAKLPVCERIAR